MPARAAVLLTSRLLPRAGAPLSTREYWDLAASVGDPERLVGCDLRALQSITGFAEHQALRIGLLLDDGPALEAEIGRQAEAGVRVLGHGEPGYPDRLVTRLGAAAPPVLHVAGDPALLARDGVGIVGSRNVGREAREVAEQVARAAVEAGLPVISGVARGIDQTAMGAALEAGGRVVGLPADALARLLKDPAVRAGVDGGGLCLATPYAPSAGFSVGAAMGRNKLIYGLSQVTLVVTSDDGTGGTWAGATEALQRNFAPVAVWAGAGSGPGNAKLVRRGAVAVESAGQLLATPGRDESPPPDGQLRIIF